MNQGSKPKKKIPCIVMTRVVGYLAPVRNFNVAQKQMHEDRKVFKVPEMEVK